MAWHFYAAKSWPKRSERHEKYTCDAPATSVPRPRPRRRCVRSPHRDRDADAALGHAIALGYAQGPGAWGANHIIMPDGARFSMLEADPMKLTYY